MPGQLGKKYQPMLKYKARKCSINSENIQTGKRAIFNKNWNEIYPRATPRTQRHKQ